MDEIELVNQVTKRPRQTVVVMNQFNHECALIHTNKKRAIPCFTMPATTSTKQGPGMPQGTLTVTKANSCPLVFIRGSLFCHRTAWLILKMGSNNAITMKPTSAPTTKINAGAKSEMTVFVCVRM